MRARNQIGAIGAWEGNSQITLADIFDVAVDGSADAAGTKIIIIEAMTAGEIIVKGNVRLLAGVLNWGGTIVIEGDTTLPGGEMKSGTIFVKGKVLEMLPLYKDEGTEEVDGVTYRKYTGDLSRNGGCAVRECVKAHSRGFFFCAEGLCSGVDSGMVWEFSIYRKTGRLQKYYK